MAWIAALLALVLTVGTTPLEPAVDPLVVFWGDGCPHCEAEWEMLADLAASHPELEVLGYEVWANAANRELFIATMAELGEEPTGVPTTVFGDQVWVGYSDVIGTEIRRAVEAAFADESDAIAPPTEQGGLELPFLGRVDPENQSLLVATLVIGFVDGFNPCSLWALSMLLALVLRTGSRRRVMAVGATFLAVTASLYGIYIVGLYSALDYASNVGWVRTLMAAVALAFGLVNLKDYWWFKQGPSLTIPDRAKPKLYRRMRGVALDHRPLPAVLAGTAALAVGVSLLETPCTAGYPLLWSNLLAGQGVETATALALFGVYMAVFLLDELAVFGVAVGAMRVAKLEERHGRVLKLFSGMLMVSLAAALLFAPELMQSVSGALATFAGAAVAAVGVLVIDRRRAAMAGSSAGIEQRDRAAR
jgi:cytochrome c biogenesis protein CcdA/thiol-disulfide isomerase/thioredoxin